MTGPPFPCATDAIRRPSGRISHVRRAYAKRVLPNYETSRDRNGSSQGLPPYGGVLRSIIAVPLFSAGNKGVVALS